MCTDGRPRGLLAHVDFGAGRNSAINKNPLKNAGMTATTLTSPRDIEKTTPGQALRQRNSSVSMVGYNNELLGTGRYGVCR